MYQCPQNDQKPNFFINQPMVFLIICLQWHTLQQAINLQKEESFTEYPQLLIATLHNQLQLQEICSYVASVKNSLSVWVSHDSEL